MNLPLWMAARAEGVEFALPSRFKMASAMMERAEFPVQRNKTLNVSAMT